MQGANLFWARAALIFALLYGVGATAYVMRRSGLDRGSRMAATLILLLLPAGMNWIYLFSKEFIHDLMMYAYVAAPIYAVVVSEIAWDLALADVQFVSTRKRALAYALPLAVCLLLLIPGAVHTDLYDRMDIIPFDRIEAFYRQYLK